MASIVVPAILRFSRITADNLYQINKSLNRLPHASYVFSWRRQHFGTITEETKELIKELQQKLIKMNIMHQVLIKMQYDFSEWMESDHDHIRDQIRDLIKMIEEEQDLIEEHQESMIKQQELNKEQQKLIKMNKEHQELIEGQKYLMDEMEQWQENNHNSIRNLIKMIQEQQELIGSKSMPSGNLRDLFKDTLEDEY